MDEQMVVHPYNGLRLSDEKEWTRDKYHMHYNKWEKPDSKLSIQFVGLRFFSKKQKFRKEIQSVLPGSGDGGTSYKRDKR